LLPLIPVIQQHNQQEFRSFLSNFANGFTEDYLFFLHVPFLGIANPILLAANAKCILLRLKVQEL